MQRCGEPSHNLEAALLSLVTKVGLPKQRSGPSAQKRECVKPFFRDAPTVSFGLSLVPAIHQERRDAHDDNKDRIPENRIGGQKIDNTVERPGMLSQNDVIE